MVEIVFSESACGSLKIAQTYGRGKYRGSAISVFIRHENGSVPSDVYKRQILNYKLSELDQVHDKLYLENQALH